MHRVRRSPRSEHRPLPRLRRRGGARAPHRHPGPRLPGLRRLQRARGRRLRRLRDAARRRAAGDARGRADRPLPAPGTPVVRAYAKGGGSAARAVAASGTRSPRATLVLERGAGVRGTAYPLAPGAAAAGRGPGALSFPGDPALAPHHATFIWRDGRCACWTRARPAGATCGSARTPSRRCSPATRSWWATGSCAMPGRCRPRRRARPTAPAGWERRGHPSPRW